MNLLERIKQDIDLQPFIVDICDENDVSVLISDKIDKDDYLIIKVDNYYNSLNVENRPASLDCLIIQKCKGVIESYAVSLVELKGTETTHGFDLDNMLQKFTTCFEDFMSKLFNKYFDRDFKRIDLFFVSNIDVYRKKNKGQASLGLKLESLMGRRFIFREKRYMIIPYMPIPEVKACYST